MEITSRSQDNVMILKISGRLDTTHYNEFEKKLMQIIDEGQTRIAMDLENLDYISSSGLRVFLMGLKRLNTRGGHMALCCLQESISSIFRIAGFNTIFSIFPDLEQGVAHCAS